VYGYGLQPYTGRFIKRRTSWQIPLFLTVYLHGRDCEYKLFLLRGGSFRRQFFGYDRRRNALLIPARYINPEISGLKTMIQKGVNHVPFDLTK
jgi:hypothetical protein